ncbi:sulfite exporter TauE/SafE family protein [Campylobacter sp.]|uniref:sulfite exporter TauE/SafE family protein n=1 Tax=Campylobacter sp. TaxID=205 RepID=UPI00270909D1|nr:sulfite exporter TauE/SafE family protein [Campylobacter sp.]
MDSATLISIVLVALSSSLAHCVGMCGGFMIAISNFLDRKNSVKNIFVIIGYNASRVSAYILQGAVFGAFGAVFTLSVRARGYLFFAIGVFLVVLGIGIICRGGILNFIEKNTSVSKFINLKMRELLAKKSKFGFLALGFLNGFLPCGVVYYFLALAVSSASALKGALVMSVFGVVSMVMMSSYVLVLKFLNDKFRNFMLYVSGFLIAGHGVYLAFLGFMATK